MSEDQFTKLFKYMEKRFDAVDKRFDKVDADIRDTKSAVAELAGQLKDYHTELVMLAHKVDRLEKWINQIAQKTGVKLEY